MLHGGENDRAHSGGRKIAPPSRSWNSLTIGRALSAKFSSDRSMATGYLHCETTVVFTPNGASRRHISGSDFFAECEISHARERVHSSERSPQVFVGDLRLARELLFANALP